MPEFLTRIREKIGEVIKEKFTGTVRIEVNFSGGAVRSVFFDRREKIG